MNAVSLPQLEIYSGNPYWERLQDALARLGVTFVSTEDKLYLQWGWLVRHRRDVDVLHLHHLQHHYDYQQTRASWQMLLKFVGKLILARLLGYRIVWTMHNVYPHQRLRPLLVGRLAHIAVAQLAHAVIVHCEYAREALAREFYRRRRVHTIPHPSYVGVYPDTIDRQQARNNLGLPQDAPVFLFLGAIRPYKGIDHLIATFRRLPEDARLVIAGKPWRDTFVAELRTAVGDDRRIALRPHFVPDDELQRYFNAADVVVLPYAKVLSSGSALLALSFGRAIVAPRTGCLAEDVTPDVGVLYDPADTDGLFRALQQCLAADLAQMGRNAAQRARQLTWDGMAEKTLAAYGRSPAAAVRPLPSNFTTAQKEKSL